MPLDANMFEAIGADLAAVAAVTSAVITFVFYRELVRIERARSQREMAEFRRQKREKRERDKQDIFEKSVRDFFDELRGRSHEHYPIHEVMLDLSNGEDVKREIATVALDRYLKRKEKIPSERESLREIIFSHLDQAEPRMWPGWETRSV